MVSQKQIIEVANRGCNPITIKVVKAHPAEFVSLFNQYRGMDEDGVTEAVMDLLQLYVDEASKAADARDPVMGILASFGWDFYVNGGYMEQDAETLVAKVYDPRSSVANRKPATKKKAASKTKPKAKTKPRRR